ncbi:hypothetical protein BB559_002369 [Furculomyces boomerangus]|uniref:Glycerol-3-phosphate dehydrogenase [NAD(+)] n=2 Tax=Harpellales TaxID=61421 RepID=A0A2T9YVZ8_9FUNG|nr:hypothetical protein BB559_002369 [Furculomyces boomerangus]PVZ99146.1 hypothetical protein BB558_004837 [Smittium angustum]PWA00442.1 hypothetical protein BB558_003480 [Smittium angustum]
MQKICIYGAGNWGTTAARILASNTSKIENLSHKVTLYAHKETFNGKDLAQLINQTKENTKYLPGFKIPDNVFATSDIFEALKDTTLLVFVVPHQFLESALENVRKYADIQNLKIISLIKGMYIERDGIKTTTQLIKSILGVQPSVLSGANIAPEIAAEGFCESTLGCLNEDEAKTWVKLFQTDYFRIQPVKDVNGVEVCGALKNVVAVAVGLADGLGFGNNTKSAVMRIGLLEIKKFAQMYYPDTPDSIFLESCGIADLVASSFGGRNFRLSSEFAKTGKPFDQLEKELLGGQKLQGPHTSLEVNLFLKNMNKIKDFPLFTTVYEIAYEGENPQSIIKAFTQSYVNSSL